VNIVFVGHVDAGKSTISGQVLYSTGMVDERTIEKYTREATEQKRESWFLAYIMDTNEEERAKGKTVEVGRAPFTTAKKRYTILDAPGHKNYVPNMIAGAAQADVAILVISARQGEFEAGFDKAGQTKEHALLIKTLGVSRIVVLVNKMDDSSVNWGVERYNFIVNKLTPFLKGLGYATAAQLQFIPVSGILGLNIKKEVDEATCPFYRGPTLLALLDAMDPLPRANAAPLRVPILGGGRDLGAVFRARQSRAGHAQARHENAAHAGQRAVLGHLGLHRRLARQPRARRRERQNRPQGRLGRGAPAGHCAFLCRQSGAVRQQVHRAGAVPRAARDQADRLGRLQRR
jgi:peptide chain release factor subunit 3